MKYELISTHTARRSFATNAYKAGVPTLSIMKITGHTKESTFLKYIKVSAEENADMLKNHPFFGGKGNQTAEPNAEPNSTNENN
jgi:site-specific recombinase XerD